jgi:cytochrome c oxidase subunit 3
MDVSLDARRHGRDERTAETLLLAFLATVVMLFAGFTSAWLIRRTGSDWGRVALPPLAYANTFVLALASATLERARRAPAPSARAWLATTLVLGLGFLAGQVHLWRALSSAGAFVTATPQGAFLFLLSAVHGLHLLGGLVALACAVARAARPRLAAVYWHFLGLVWLYVLLLLHVR